MTGGYTVHLYLIGLIVVALGAGTLVPPLTTSRDWFADETPELRSVRSERSFCDNNLSNVDCVCYANKAGHVLSYDGPRLPAASLMDRERLARSQAAAAC